MSRWVAVSIGAALVVADMATALAQRSPAVAEVRLDVNGDGVPDVVRIEDPPAVSVSITGAPSARVWKPFTTAARLAGGRITHGSGPRYPGGTVIVAEAHFGGRGAARREETIVLQWRSGKAVELWRGPVGLQGPDREWSQRVVASPQGLLRHQGKPGVERCDGAPVLAFLERWDPRGKRFRRVKGAPVRVDANAPVVRATAEPGAVAAAPLVFRRASASSMLGAASARELVPPRELVDGRTDTSWREGAPASGRGEVITFRSALPDTRVAAVRFIPGDSTSAAAFARHNRLKRFALLVGDRAHWVEVDADPNRSGADAATAYIARLPAAIAADCVSVILDDVYPGRGGSQTAIAEMAVLTEAELTPGALYPALAEAVAGGGLAGDSAQKTLARGGSAAARALLAAADKAGRTAAERRRLRVAMAALDAPELIGELVAGLVAADTDDDARAILGRRLARHGDAAVGPLVTAMAGPATERAGAIAAVGVLGSIGDSGVADALVAVAAHRDKQVRRAVARAMARARLPRKRLLFTATDHSNAVARATAWRALGIIALRTTDAGERGVITSAMAADLVDATDYELRYRLLYAASAIPDPDLTAAVGTALARFDGPWAPALRRVAAAALSQNPSAEAAALLATLLADADPGVRGRAARALGERDHPTSDPPLGKLLAADGWPEVRLSAATALGQRCQRPAPARNLYAAVDGDDDGRVRLAALAALVQCDAAGLAARLVAIAGDRQRDPGLRARACLLYGARGAADRAPALIDLFKRARNQALGGGTGGLDVAAACLTAMGNTGAASVTDVLLDASRDAAFPEIQASAAAALGVVCPASARVVLAELRTSPQPQVAVAARAAYQRCFR